MIAKLQIPSHSVLSTKMSQQKGQNYNGSFLIWVLDFGWWKRSNNFSLVVML